MTETYEMNPFNTREFYRVQKISDQIQLIHQNRNLNIF